MFGINGNVFWGSFLGVLIVGFIVIAYVALSTNAINEESESANYFEFLEWNFMINTLL